MTTLNLPSTPFLASMIPTPRLFIGHGAPMNATRDSSFTQSLHRLGQSLPRPRAVLSISAHWETDGTQVLAQAAPPKLNDFFGDHPDLEALAYAAPGAPALAERTQTLIPGSTLAHDRGVDHGTWSVATHLFPAADVPIYALSIDRRLDNAGHLALGRALRPLRDEGVLIMGSGNLCHNLAQLDYDQHAEPRAWNLAFDAWIADALRRGDVDAIVDHARRAAPHSALAVPTPEHFTPLLYVLGAGMPQDRIEFIHEGFEHGAISLRSAIWQ